jgi:phospholipid transport system substrate-binding protein
MRYSRPVAPGGVLRLLATVLLLAAGSAAARAQDTQDAGRFLAEFSDRAITQLAETGIGEAEQERRFRALLGDGFDLPAIGRFVLGRYWKRTRGAEQAAFIAVFEDMIVNRFLPLFGELSGERLNVGLVRPFRNNPDFFTVSTVVPRPGSEDIRVDWRVQRRDGRHKIVDIVAEGVSISVTLRSEYTTVLKNNGGDVQALIDQLREKIANL